LKSQGYNPADIEKYVRRWFVLSILTGRYSSSPESKFDSDIREISSKKFGSFLKDVEDAELSKAFWESSLVQSLDTSVASSPYFNVYLASQVNSGDKGFLSEAITVKELIEHRGDIHHVFPRDYLKSNGLKRGQYNQIANYVYMQSEINIKIGKKSPDAYFKELKKQCSGGKLKYGGIDNEKDLLKNLSMNCLPGEVMEMDLTRYEEFLIKRRKLIAEKIREYYNSL